MRVTDPFSELIVHHEVMHVFLGASQLQFASEDGYYESGTAGALHIADHNTVSK